MKAMKEHFYCLATGAAAITAFAAVCSGICGLFWLVSCYPTPGAIILTTLLAWAAGILIRRRDEAK